MKKTLKEKIIFYIDACLIYIIRFINKIHLWLINKFEIKKYHFKFMVPKDDAKNIKYYEKQLLEALENEKVKNIAVTGDYGAGKSSFLKTFEKNHNEYSFLDISLATFDENNRDISIIEKSILEQLFYRESINKIPQSRFKKIKSYNRAITYLKAFIGILFILSILFLLKPKTFINLKIYNWIENNYNINNIEYFSILIIFIGIFYILKYFIKNFNGLTLNKFNLQTVEIEAKKDEESSLLNKYIDELLYFFEKTNYNVIVFQDLDRFENSEIFIKLRELNRFLNNAKQINRRIVFLYVLKDEVFKNQNERVKFFDVIIPIIPYVNHKTSYDILIKWFKNEIDKDFLKSIAIYIQDMRLLKNIYNEYKIFKLQIGKGLNKTKLLAIVIYKNFYPQDYNKLHQGKSIINQVINRKYEYIKNLENNNLEKIVKLEKNIKELEKDLIDNKDVMELRKIYLFEILKTISANINGYFYCNNEQINISTALNDNNFEKIKKCNNVRANTYNNGISFQNIEKSINPNLTYQDRENLILTGTNEKIENLNKQIENLKEEIEQLNTFNLRDILNAIDIDKEIKDLKNYDLLKFLLLNGYIDEDYYLYISNEMKNSLTPNDVQYLKSIKNHIALDCKFKLDNIDEIIDNLSIQDFNKNSILNIYLVNFLIDKDNQVKYKKQIKSLFKFLNTKYVDIEKFIAYCIDWIPNKVEFVKLIVKYNQNTWKIIEKFGTKQSLDTYCGWIFTYADIVGIKKLVGFKEYFENKTYLQSFSPNEANKVVEYIKNKKIKFTKLKTSDIVINNFILENNHYEINIDMINFIVFNEYTPRKEIEQNLKTANYTTIKNLSDYYQKILYKYILENINKYIENVFLKLEENTKESEESIIELLNNKNIDNNLKIKIIEKEEAIISDLNLIENSEIWKFLIKYNKLQPTWQNIGVYYNKIKIIDEFLFGFLETNSNELSKTKINSKFCKDNEDFDTDLLEEILLNNAFDLKIYKLLIKSNEYWYPNLQIDGLDEEKIKILLENNIFQLTNENIQNLKEYSLHFDLIIKNLENFIEKIQDFTLETNDYITILNKNIDLEDKINIIKSLDTNVIKSDNDLQKTIIDIFIKNNMLVDSNYLFEALFYNQDNETWEESFKFLISQLKRFDKCQEIQNYLNEFGYPYDELTNINAKRLEFNKNEDNIKLLEFLIDKNCISSIRENKDKSKFIVERKRK